MNWHKDPEDWHGPIQREELTEVWDGKDMASIVFEYRLCGCVTTREGD